MAVMLPRYFPASFMSDYCDRGFESHVGMDVCVCSVCVFSVFTVSSETASRPNKKVSEDLSLDKPLQCHIQSQQISL
jgi:hypothetical protein